MTTYPGIDYAIGTSANRDTKTGIRYGVINQNELLQAWADASEPVYPEPDHELTEEEEEEFNEFCEAVGFEYDGEGIKAQCGEDGDIFIVASPYFTYAQFCSPCAPGACYLTNYLEEPLESNRAYCFGHDWFEDGKAPYPVYSVETGKLVEPA